MKKTLVSVMAMVIALMMVLGACSTPTPTPAAATTAPVTSTEVSAATSVAPTKQPVEVSLLLTNHDPDASLPGQYCKAWAALVNEKSNGRIEVVVNNGGSLAKPTESLTKVKEGAVDIAWGLQSFYAGQFPMTDGLALPYLPYTSASQASTVMMNIWLNTTLLQSDPGYAGTKVILIRSNCDAPITTAKVKLNTAADLNGKTIRASVKPLQDWLLKFGATGKGCPITELFQNLVNGAFDGALTDWHGVNSFKLYDNCAKYFADEQVSYACYYFLMNEAKYNSLSAENKAVIDECSGLAALDLNKDAWDTMKADTTAKIVAAGGEVYTLPVEEHQKLVDAATAVKSDWVTAGGANASALYNKILELCAAK